MFRSYCQFQVKKEETKIIVKNKTCLVLKENENKVFIEEERERERKRTSKSKSGDKQKVVRLENCEHLEQITYEEIHNDRKI